MGAFAATAAPQALSPDQVGKIGIGVIVGLVVIGVLLGLVITAVVGRLAILVVVVALGIWVWHQRSTIEHDVSTSKCQLSTTFFGVHVQAPPSVVQACQKRATG